jgi:hypothetical protein
MRDTEARIIRLIVPVPMVITDVGSFVHMAVRPFFYLGLRTMATPRWRSRGYVASIGVRLGVLDGSLMVLLR